MSKLLIAYFSHEGETYAAGKIVELEVGNTKTAAQMLERMTGGDLFRIETVTPYPHGHMETIGIAQQEQRENARPALTGRVENMADYDTVILGYPNWWGTMPMAVFTFLESYDFTGKTILPLCTHEGSGLGHSEDEIKHIVPTAKVERGLAIQGCRVGRAEKELQKWLARNGLIK